MSGDYISSSPAAGRGSFRYRTEGSREREALRYLHSWIELYKPPYIRRNAFPTAHSMPVPAACHDTALAAFAQLAALRLGARRAFITILSTHTEHVLVESTRSMSLQSDFVADSKDESWLGTCCFPRTDGINDMTLDSWRKARSPRQAPEDQEFYYTEGASEHWHIISDLRLHSNAAQRSFVQRAPSPRFYFSIPLRDQEGTVIGSLSILDDRPRYGISATEMAYCEDLSDTITQHLQSSIFRSQRQRSERLIQALGVFNNGGTSLRDWWIGQDSSSMSRGGRRERDRTEGEKNSRFDSEFGKEESPPSYETASSYGASRTPDQHHKSARSAGEENKQAENERMVNGVAGEDFSRPTNTASNAAPTNDDGGASSDDADTMSSRSGKSEKGARAFDLTSQIDQAYSRASKLLRESLGASGVAFVDATTLSSNRSNDQLTSSGSSDDNRTLPSSDTDHSDSSNSLYKKCKLAAITIQARSDGGRSASFELSEKDLARMIKSGAKVFSFMEDGSAYSGSEGSACSGASSEAISADDGSKPRIQTRRNRNARKLRKAVGDAGSIAFYPIWDDNRGRWRAALVVWTTSNGRFFHPEEDITYLSAFSHSLRAELARIETTASDIAKGKFISSVSHELRSPLHGILAGIELIQDSQLTAFQSEMASSVALAGRTLLDTVDHILDYSKISNLSRAQKKDRAKIDAMRHKSTESITGSGLINVDLACLTEEVTESTVSSFRHLKRLARDAESPDDSDDHAVSVALEIENRETWKTPMTPGIMTRLISNILGNALKYTHKGVVLVKLFTDHETDGGQSPDQGVFVNLQIQDTGIGMSRHFLDSDLFTAFRQANPHAPGTGLGLSIVKEVAKELNASVTAKSELGKGTSILVRFLAHFNKQDTPEFDARSHHLTHPTSISQTHFRMLDMRTQTPDVQATGASTFAESVLRTASQWLHCEISFSDDISSCPPGTVCAISEKDLLMMYETDSAAVERLMSDLASAGAQILVLSQSVNSVKPAFDFEHFPLRPLYVYQPIGPQKLLRVINNVQDSIMTRQPNDYATRALNTPHMIRGDLGRRTSDEDVLSPLSPRFAHQPDTSSKSRSGRTKSMPVINEPLDSFEQSSDVTDTSAVMPLRTRPKSPMRPGQVVLLVEDNDINMRLLLALMKKLQLPCESAVNGLEALEKYQAAPMQYFLILMDMDYSLTHAANMPVMDGFEATNKIRELERKEKLRKVYIAAVTGVTNTESKQSAKSAGVNRYVTKPIRMKDLTSLIDEVKE